MNLEGTFQIILRHKKTDLRVAYGLNFLSVSVLSPVLPRPRILIAHSQRYFDHETIFAHSTFLLTGHNATRMQRGEDTHLFKYNKLITETTILRC